MKTLPADTQDIDVDAIRPFIRRARNKADFDGVVESIRAHGLKVPIEVRDITDEPAETRRRPEGGHYKYELVKGEGRTEAHKVIGRRKIAAYVVKAKQSDIAGRFLAENMIRKPLPWTEKAKLVRDEIASGKTAAEVAKSLVLTDGHVRKLVSISRKTAQGLESDVAAMAMSDAVELTELPEKDQQIVVEVLRENPNRLVRDIIRKATETREKTGELSASDLRASLKRVDEDLTRLRDSMKVTRLHHSLGPQNLQTLLADKKFRAALTAAKVNVQQFEKVSEA